MYLPKAFEVCGILSDVYISRNRNAKGQIFRLLSFIHVKGVDKLNNAMNNVYLG